MEVIVTKSIDLKSGETLRMFTEALSQDAREHMAKNLRLDLKTGTAGVYVIEVMSNVVVCEVYQSTQKEGHKYWFMAAKYEREDDGSFTFSDTAEVERVTTFRPKTQVSVAKSADGSHYAAKRWPDDTAVVGISKRRGKPTVSSRS
jgi:hypothetical protein